MNMTWNNQDLFKLASNFGNIFAHSSGDISVLLVNGRLSFFAPHFFARVFELAHLFPPVY